jgi:L-threonylcarbamoyladenylate synthase
VKTLKLTNTNHKQLITETCKVLEAGGLVIYPTETVYGIGVDATNHSAVEKLIRYKSRREGKPLSIAVADTSMAQKFIQLSPQAQDLHQRFLPGPYTIVSKGKQTVAPHVESEFGTLGIRIPDYSLILDLVKKFDKPITATSANASGKKRPYTVQDIFDRLSEKQKNLIDLVIDAGKLPPNEPSIVIDTTLTTPLTVRGNFDHQTPTQKFSTNSDLETRDLAGKLTLKNWEKIKKTGIIIGLNGELGTGKTVFTQGIAKFLQITEPLSSPTYTYMNQYDFNRHNVTGTLNHLDVWKIDSKESFDLLEIPQLIKPGTITVIEWWQQIAGYWPNALPITFQATLTEPNISSSSNPNHREITIFENEN